MFGRASTVNTVTRLSRVRSVVCGVSVYFTPRIPAHRKRTGITRQNPGVRKTELNSESNDGANRR